MPQSRYWQEMYDLKSHSFYILISANLPLGVVLLPAASLF
jgi:hypothetical protein